MLEVQGTGSVLDGERPLCGVDLVISEVEVDDGLHARDQLAGGDRVHALGTAHSDGRGLVIPVQRRPPAVSATARTPPAVRADGDE